MNQCRYGGSGMSCLHLAVSTCLLNESVSVWRQWNELWLMPALSCVHLFIK